MKQIYANIENSGDGKKISVDAKAGDVRGRGGTKVEANVRSGAAERIPGDGSNVGGNLEGRRFQRREKAGRKKPLR